MYKMYKVYEYDVLEFDDLPALVEAVNERLKYGWVAQGGVLGLQTIWTEQGYPEYSRTYYQAITKVSYITQQQHELNEKV